MSVEMFEDKSDTEKHLDQSYGTDKILAEKKPKQKTGRPSEIEKAGEQVIQHLLKLARDTDMSYESMAQRINEIYGTNLNKKNISYFFATCPGYLEELTNEQKALNVMRAKVYLEYNGHLVKDIKVLDSEISKVLEDEFLESDKRAKAIGDLLDKKGRLLLRHARLSGGLKSDKAQTQIDKMQVNVFNRIENQKSEIIEKLKTFKPEKVEKKNEDGKVIDIEPEE